MKRRPLTSAPFNTNVRTGARKNTALALVLGRSALNERRHILRGCCCRHIHVHSAYNGAATLCLTRKRARVSVTPKIARNLNYRNKKNARFSENYGLCTSRRSVGTWCTRWRNPTLVGKTPAEPRKHGSAGVAVDSAGSAESRRSLKRTCVSSEK